MPPDKPHDPYAALREPNYRLFAPGFLASSMGLQMLATAIGWEVYERTHDPLALGFIGLARALPVLLLALPAGQVIDLFDRKKILVLTQAAFALLALALAAASYYQAPLPLIYVLLVATGCVRSFNGPSRSSLLPSLVGTHDGAFHNAVTWNSGVFQLSATIGPLLAGIMLAQLHAAWPVYIATACGCGLLAVLAIFLKPRPLSRPPQPLSMSSMLAGAGHVWREKTVLAAISLDLFAVLLGGATGLLPMYAKDILHAGPIGLGLLRAAPYLGAFTMAIVLAHMPPFRRAGAALLWSVAAFGVCIIIFGLSTSIWLSLAALFISGAVDNISVVVRHVLVQLRTPEHLRGRVSAVNSLFIESSNELGAFESGAVARLFGPVASVVSGGIGTIIVVAGVALAWPEIRRLGRIQDLETQTPPPAPTPPT